MSQKLIQSQLLDGSAGHRIQRIGQQRRIRWRTLQSAQSTLGQLGVENVQTLPLSRHATQIDRPGRRASNEPLVEVRLDNDTVWLTQEQMTQLFGRERSVITKHIRNVFNEGELDEKSNVQNLHIPHSDKPVRFYNLDVIISVGYRVNI